MTIQPIVPDKKLEITFEPDEWSAVVKASQQNPGELRQLLGNWLKSKVAAWEQDDRNSVVGKLAQATPAQLQQIKQVLGL